MNAIKELREYLRRRPSGQSAKTLARLAVALDSEQEFPLADLYALPILEFELAIELMRDWRLDRYYSSRLSLFDAVHDVLGEEVS